MPSQVTVASREQDLAFALARETPPALDIGAAPQAGIAGRSGDRAERDDRPEFPAQVPEKMDFAPGRARDSEATCGADAAQEAHAWTRPEPRQDEPLNDSPKDPPKHLENIGSAPTNERPGNLPPSGGASDVGPAFPNPIAFRPIKLRMALNGVMAC